MSLVGHQSSWEAENGEISVVEDLGYSTGRLVLCDVGLDEPHKMIDNYEDVLSLRLLSQVGRNFHFDEIYVDQIHRLGRQDGYQFRCLNLGLENDASSTVSKG